jgi:CheY-like chemotaxis protein
MIPRIEVRPRSDVAGRAARWAPVQLLLVEDSPSDAAMTLAALREGRLDYDVWVAVDGEAAMAFLRRAGDQGDAPRPDLVLLDLNLPVKSGREVLEEVKSAPDLRSIPVIVFTTSDAPKDIVDTYGRYANSYVTKPVAMEGFVRSIRSVEDFWLSVARIPVIHSR